MATSVHVVEVPFTETVGRSRCIIIAVLNNHPEQMLANCDLVKTTLVSGDPELCKALLFEAAITWAKEGHWIHYFAAKQFESLPPVFHDRSEPSAEALKHIMFIYTVTYEDLVAQLARLHTFHKPPSVILVEDLDVYADYRDIRMSSRELHASRCCAVLLNAALSCAKRTSRSVHVCAVSVSTDEDRRATCQKYFDNHWSVGAETRPEDPEIGATVWMRRDDGKKAMDFKRLDDAVLVLTKVLSCDDVEVDNVNC